MRPVMVSLTRFSFGATSAIITCLAFIIGLSKSPNPTLGIIGSLLVIAIADNISDSLGIHIYQESDQKKSDFVRISTILNFLTRFFVIMVFIAFVLWLPLILAIICSIVWGLSLLIVLSYFIAKVQQKNPVRAIIEHVAIAIIVILISNFLSEWILHLFIS